ncbi:hypothetical protein ANO11243_079250 [Dothideomycetidae sp. 11243]|nr:hypothetical protein ANO11243_079250 [fungal sp. No.11243]
MPCRSGDLAFRAADEKQQTSRRWRVVGDVGSRGRRSFVRSFVRRVPDPHPPPFPSTIARHLTDRTPRAVPGEPAEPHHFWITSLNNGHAHARPRCNFVVEM